MANDEFRGIVRGGVVELDRETALPDGTQVLVTPISHLPRTGHPPGTSAAVIAAMESLPDLPSEWVDELEQAIEEGKRSRRRPIPFAEDAADDAKTASTGNP